MKDKIVLVSRILMAAIFLMAGFGKIMNPGGTMGYMSAMGMPLTVFFLVCAIIIEAGGGLSILLGFKMRYGALALALFLISVTLIFHTNFADQMQVIQFLKNSAIIGGLLLMMDTAPGPYSIDGRT